MEVQFLNGKILDRGQTPVQIFNSYDKHKAKYGYRRMVSALKRDYETVVNHKKSI